jgi:pimeloyl-ACP methyl ester carboxylesterase
MRMAAILLLACLAARPVFAAETVEAIPLAFESAGVTLDGSLIVPKTPLAAVVLIHGGGPAERYTGLAKMLADEDIAVFTYDKRGAGRSGGTYEAKNDIGAHNLALLAADAAAAFTAMRRHERLANVPAGIIGLSQAGWIAPVAAQTPGVKFMALWSGPVATTSEEIHYSALAKKNPEIWRMQSAEEIKAFTASVPTRADDFDPRSAIAKLDIPALWFFGGKDTSIPVALSAMRLNELIRAGKTNFSTEVFPEDGHNLADRTTQRGFKAMVAWVKKTAR